MKRLREAVGGGGGGRGWWKGLVQWAAIKLRRAGHGFDSVEFFDSFLRKKGSKFLYALSLVGTNSAYRLKPLPGRDTRVYARRVSRLVSCQLLGLF